MQNKVENKKYLSCRDKSEDMSCFACFFPIGFYMEEKSSLAHLAEHCLVSALKELTIGNGVRKPFFLEYNGFTTMYYSCIWFRSTSKIYANTRNIFLESLLNISANNITEDDIAHEKEKIRAELMRLSQDENVRRTFIHQNLLEEGELNLCTRSDVLSKINQYFKSDFIIIEYGNREEFDEHTTNDVEHSEVIITDTKIVFKHSDNVGSVQLIRFLIYIFRKLGFTAYSKQYKQNLAMIALDQPVREVISQLPHPNSIQFQVLLEDFYSKERVASINTIDYLKNQYKLYIQTGEICNRIIWLQSINGIPKRYCRFIKNII